MKTVNSILVIVFLIIGINSTSAQNPRKMVSVDTADMSYRIFQGDSTLIKKGDTLLLADSVLIHADWGRVGILGISSKRWAADSIYGPKGPDTLKKLFYTKVRTKLYDCFFNFLSGTLNPILSYDKATIINWGEQDSSDSTILSVSFICDNNEYKSFKAIPTNRPFDFSLRNDSDSVLICSVLFNYALKKSDHYQQVPPIECVVDDEGRHPIVLFPGDTVCVPSSFFHPGGYLKYHLFVFGITDLDLLQYDPKSPIRQQIPKPLYHEEDK